MMLCKTSPFLFSILFILLGLGLARVLREKLKLNGSREKDNLGSQEKNNIKPVFENILNVNQKTGNLIRPNASGDENGLFEADIRLRGKTRAIVFGEKSKRQFGSTADFSILWQGQTVYYTIDDDIASERNRSTFKAIKAAMAELERKTCIRFKKRATEIHYIHFFKESGCWSELGRIGGKQEISIGYGCEEKGIVVHEIMHSLGFFHEQSRPDRDKYIEIMTNNIEDGYDNQFKKYDTGEINSRGSPYDYSSIMHYDAYAFSKNGLPTVRIRNPQIEITLGQEGLSKIDINQINSIYKCKVDPTEEEPTEEVPTEEVPTEEVPTEEVDPTLGPTVDPDPLDPIDEIEEWEIEEWDGSGSGSQSDLST